MAPSQNDTGRAFEYGLAIALNENLEESTICASGEFEKAKDSFFLVGDLEKSKIERAAGIAIQFLKEKDSFFKQSDLEIKIQSDQRGAIGDVRDLLIESHATGTQLGISAKNRHTALKHSRLSRRLNFGRKWFGLPCSDKYFEIIRPVFSELREIGQSGEKWENLSDVHQRFYVPVLDAFIAEINRMSVQEPMLTASGLVTYLVGNFDFYKVIKENGTVLIDSMNLYGVLGWGKKVPLPQRVIEAIRPEGSSNTVVITFDNGWSISFRIHSASKNVEPSLKFDIQLISYPREMYHHTIEY